MADVPDLFPLCKRIVESTSEGVWVIDAANRTTFVNQSMADMFGYTREGMIGRSMFDLMDDEGRRIAAANVERRKQGISEAHEFRFRRKDGTPLWTRLTTNPLQDAAGAYAGALALATDLTSERLQMAEGARLWRILDESLNEIYIFRKEDLRFVYVNRGALQNLGYTLEQMRERTPLAIKPEHTHASFTSLIAPLVTGDKQRIEFQTIHRRKDGSAYPVEVHLQLVPDSEPRTFVAIINDISKRLDAERSLRISEARFRSLIEHSADLIALLGSDGSVKYLSPAFEALLGYPVDSWLNRNVLELAWPDDLGTAEAVFAKSLQSPAQVVPWQLRLRHADGSPRWFEGSGTNYVADMNTAGIVVNCRDVTERRRAEEALRVKDQAIGTALNGIAIADADGRFIYVNAAFVRLWGYASEGELLGKTPLDVGEPAGAQMVLDELRTRGVWQGEVIARRKDGSTFDVLLSANVVLDASGKPAYMMASALDISEAKRLQAQLLQAQKMEAIGRLAGGVAHDFNNLLTVIRGYLELALLDLNASDPLHRDLSVVVKASDSAATLTQQLLAFSRKQIIDPQILNMNDVVQRLRPMLNRLIGEDVDFQVVVAPGLGLVRFDAGQSEQILMNLAVNARDAMPDGGKLTIETANVRLGPEHMKMHDDVQPGDYVMLAVSDTGTGMSDDVKAHVFEPFFTTKGTGSGTGLGLAMTYGAVSQNGGHIEVYSDVGHGSVFKIYLPVVRGQEVLPVRSVGALPHARGTETILLVEDEEQVRTLASRVLARLGYQVRECRDGASAVRRIQDDDEVQLLITDVVMPDMNGRVLAERIRQLGPHIKVLFTSGYTANVIVHHGVLKEGVEFLQKPYSVESLARRVREVLDKH